MIQYNGRVYDPGTGFHDYGARMYWPQIGRFISPDTAGPDLANPATFNRYSYVLNNPYKYVDPTGRDAIPVAFPDYKIAISSARVPFLGHAGIVLVDNQSGAARYFEYGRYDPEHLGLVRELSVPSVTFDGSGNPTAESLQALMSTVSEKAGHGTAVQGTYVKNDNYQSMVDYAGSRKALNDDPGRTPYDILSNNCGTFSKSVLEAGGEKPIPMYDPRPSAYMDKLQSAHGNSVTYQPSSQ